MVLWIVVGLVLLFILQAVLIALFKRRKSADKKRAEKGFEGVELYIPPENSGAIRESPVITNVQSNRTPVIYNKTVIKNTVLANTRGSGPYNEREKELPRLGYGGREGSTVEPLIGPREGIKALPPGTPVTVEAGKPTEGSNGAIPPYVSRIPEEERTLDEEANIPSIMAALDDIIENNPTEHEIVADDADEGNKENTWNESGEDDGVDIGWENEGDDQEKMDFDAEIERLGDVSFGDPTIEEDVQSDLAEKGEGATTLASIPVKKVAISTETGEELKHCSKCDGYFERGEEACPHCAEREGMNGFAKGAGMRGLDPTDREESDDETEPPRRYPEEMIFDDDDVKLEDILEGI